MVNSSTVALMNKIFVGVSIMFESIQNSQYGGYSRDTGVN